MAYDRPALVSIQKRIQNQLWLRLKNNARHFIANRSKRGDSLTAKGYASVFAYRRLGICQRDASWWTLIAAFGHAWYLFVSWHKTMIAGPEHSGRDMTEIE